MGPIKNANENYLHGSIDFWSQFTAHPDYDEFWQERSTLPHLKEISPAVLTVGGWYDGEDLSGALHTYKTIEKNNFYFDFASTCLLLVCSEKSE